MISLDLAHNWHPYTQMKDHGQHPPILIERAQGVYLYDAAGKSYIDGISSWWCNIHGHNHPELNRAMMAQIAHMSHIMFAGFTHRPAIELSRALVAVTPENLTRVFYSDNGSCAIETAMKMSLQYWQLSGQARKMSFLAFENGYHGDTFGTMGLGQVPQFKSAFSDAIRPSFVAPIGHLDSLETILNEHHHDIAALVIEPLLQCAGGMKIHSAEFLNGVGELAKRYQVHVILDEVATGFGRTGTLFACDQAEISPDFLCLSKGLTSGYLPLGVTMTTPEIYAAFYGDYAEQKTFYHGYTFCANPVACAVALASLNLFEKNQTLAHVRRLLPLFKEKLDRFSALSTVCNVRSVGLVGAFDLQVDPDKRLGYQMYLKGLEKGIVLRPLGNTLYFMPPLCILESELEELMMTSFDILKMHRL